MWLRVRRERSHSVPQVASPGTGATAASVVDAAATRTCRRGRSSLTFAPPAAYVTHVVGASPGRHRGEGSMARNRVPIVRGLGAILLLWFLPAGPVGAADDSAVVDGAPDQTIAAAVE